MKNIPVQQFMHDSNGQERAFISDIFCCVIFNCQELKNQMPAYLVKCNWLAKLGRQLTEKFILTRIALTIWTLSICQSFCLKSSLPFGNRLNLFHLLFQRVLKFFLTKFETKLLKLKSKRSLRLVRTPVPTKLICSFFFTSCNRIFP